MINAETSLKSRWDRDFQAKKGGMVGLTGKNGRESGIWEPSCGPSTAAKAGKASPSVEIFVPT